MRIKIISNNIEKFINEYSKENGATKTWIAEQLEMSPQRMYQLYKANNMTIDVALKFSEFFKCDVKELFEYEIVL